MRWREDDMAREEKFPIAQKITMINKWRHRCDMLKKQGQPVCKEICRVCDAIAQEICEDIKECHASRGFNMEDNHEKTEGRIDLQRKE